MQSILQRVRPWPIGTAILTLLTLVGSPAIGTQATEAPTTPDATLIAQNEPKTDAEFWVPSAWFDEAKPARVQIINKTNEPLEYLITTHTNFRRLTPGQSVILSDLTLPTFVNINPLSEGNVDYSISVNRKTNTVIAEVTFTRGQGDRTLHLDEKGAVYAY